MWFDGIRQPNTLYIASVSRGKDSTAMLQAIKLMGWPLDGIVSVDVWFDDDTPAELPPMVAFKDEWDRKCYDQFGIPVTRVCATKEEEPPSNLTYTDIFYRPMQKYLNSQNVQVERERAITGSRRTGRDGVQEGSRHESMRMGFPYASFRGGWCHELKKIRISTLYRRLVPQVQAGICEEKYAETVFGTAPERGAKDKYRSLHRNCG